MGKVALEIPQFHGPPGGGGSDTHIRSERLPGGAHRRQRLARRGHLRRFAGGGGGRWSPWNWKNSKDVAWSPQRENPNVVSLLVAGDTTKKKGNLMR